MASSTIPASGGGGLAPKYQKFTSSGTFTLPDGYGAAKPLLINIQVIGGGGGGVGKTAAVYTFNGSGGYRDYFGEGGWSSGTVASVATTNNGSGGSGGLCATQLYLTSNLTITVGAAGSRGVLTMSTVTNNENPTGGNFGYTSGSATVTVAGSINTTASTGGTGGTTTASVLQATGGTGGTPGNASLNFTGYNGNLRYMGYSTDARNYFYNAINPGANGTGGTPAGTTGQTTPLLGTLAGGSGNATPVRGSFGIGGVYTDAGTSTGAEGTGGGYDSNGASGAVIITWWQ
jgi:hypothetical protein